ncbi:RNA polymerase sigma factor [[Clostridium] symbiosum]|uniref:RNA polymerase sigma factor n=1 Tax=Clostridium symbiosum TaxID=1512 RepID=UPI00191E56AF|nr:RNA polymerase sigma factor [[Clostridium] symbiosum]MDY3688384.1 RNA polymerase sigma factor [[Clostridium] symbiosum]MEA4844559.1 RNA polymerase sigma factor [[Clostridium] symbiosum]
MEQWINQYQNLIYSICYKFTGNYFDAEDLAQDTFLSAYKSMAYFDGSNERAWLCKIATNKSLDYLKRAGRKSVPTEDVYFSAIAAPESVEEKYLEKEVRQKLYDCCLALKPPYREVALDYYYHEMEIGEIVKKTGKNIKTLQTQIYRAKGMLKKLYGKEEPAYGKTATH